MHAVNPRQRLIFTLTLALSAITLVGSVTAQEIDPSNDPVWTPGGHYTAELNLGAAELTLLPLVGPDQRLSMRHACAPGREVVSGVYVLIRVDGGFQLKRTHTHGQPLALASDDIVLTHCEDYQAPRSALRLPTTVLKAFETASVGAVYVR